MYGGSGGEGGPSSSQLHPNGPSTSLVDSVSTNRVKGLCPISGVGVEFRGRVWVSGWSTVVRSGMQRGFEREKRTTGDGDGIRSGVATVESGPEKTVGRQTWG